MYHNTDLIKINTLIHKKGILREEAGLTVEQMQQKLKVTILNILEEED